jgi:hypothetical protein
MRRHYGHRFAGLMTTGMFALFAARTATRPETPSPKRLKFSRAEADVAALLLRMRQRYYLETIPVLASYWLKTVYASGYSRREWNELNHLLKPAAGRDLQDQASREAIIEIQQWIEDTMVRNGRTPECRAPRLEPVRPPFDCERLTPYIAQLLNEWVPVEVARMPLKESGPEGQSSGIPALVFGSALERLLARGRLSRQTLEMLARPAGISAEHVYPADLEMLRDVALSLLGRTWAPASSVLPAAPLCLAPQSHLGVDYRKALRSAFLVRRGWSEEVRVPIAPQRAKEILTYDRVRIGSVIVTMDGRWWEPVNLQSAGEYSIVYRPGGHLRMDHSGSYATLRVPWPEELLRWSGGCGFNRLFRTFGREWRVAKCEMDGERTWLHLELFRVLPVSELIPGAERSPWKLRPVWVDMAWTALGGAVASALINKSSGPIERLRHQELIPLGRAILQFERCRMSWQVQTREAIEHLRAIEFSLSPVLAVYGRVPWRILSGRVRAGLLKMRRYPELVELLNEMVEGLPEELR